MIADDFYGLDIIDTIRVVKHLLFSNKKRAGCITAPSPEPNQRVIKNQVFVKLTCNSFYSVRLAYL